MLDFEAANYHGFTVKKGFWYGIDAETDEYVVTSGWEDNHYVCVYCCKNNTWEQEWLDVEDTDFELENIPIQNTEDKMSFTEWLNNKYGISWNEWDDRPDSGEINQEYTDYLYDGLPRFVQKYLG